MHCDILLTYVFQFTEKVYYFVSNRDAVVSLTRLQHKTKEHAHLCSNTGLSKVSYNTGENNTRRLQIQIH
jgi:hypothetical protein